MAKMSKNTTSTSTRPPRTRGCGCSTSTRRRPIPTDLVAENAHRGKQDPEYELLDTSVFDDDRYFDVFVEYAKAGADDILIRIRAINRGPEPAPLHMLPTLWFRNTWAWGDDPQRPTLAARQIA